MVESCREPEVGEICTDNLELKWKGKEDGNIYIRDLLDAQQIF